MIIITFLIFMLILISLLGVAGSALLGGICIAVVILGIISVIKNFFGGDK